MKWTHYVYGLGICAVLTAMTPSASAQIIDTENACTWAIANDDLSIPSGSIITDAELTLHNVSSTRSGAELYVQLLDNPNTGTEELTDGQSGNFFDGYGTALSKSDAWTLSSNPQTITINFMEIDDPDCWTREIFTELPVITLADESTITCTSSMLALFDYAGTGRSFGFGVDCDGVSLTGITLNLTIQSTTQQTPAETVTFTAGTTISDQNGAPVLSAISDQTVTESETLTFSVSATDADEDTLSYSTSSLPAGAAFTEQTFTWTPNYTQAGVYHVDFLVSDGTQEISQTVTITVLDKNRAPVLTAVDDKTVSEGQTLTFPVSATDPDGDTVTFNTSSLPEGAIFINGTFIWTPGYDQSGTYTIAFFASDSLLTDIETITVTVNNTNRAPILEQIADKTITTSQLVEFTVTCSDPDGDSVNVSAKNLPTGASFQNDVFSWTPSQQQVGAYEIEITANDGNGGTDTMTINITVGAVSQEWTQLFYDDFEDGLGNYADGGRDCRLYTGGKYAHQGSKAANIQDNSETLSSFSLANGLDLSSYSEIKIEFWYMPVSMDNSDEDFRLDYWDGTQWVTLKTWARNTDFENNVFYSESITLSQEDVTFTADANLRFVCDASSNYDDVYIDEIGISAR